MPHAVFPCSDVAHASSPASGAQALNNWGLVLSELAGMRPPGERGYLVAHSIAKFRRAIRLRPEFDRACYNLGTVVYAHAGTLAAPGALSPQLSQARAPCSLSTAQASTDGACMRCGELLYHRRCTEPYSMLLPLSYRDPA